MTLSRPSTTFVAEPQRALVGTDRSWSPMCTQQSGFQLRLLRCRVDFHTPAEKHHAAGDDVRGLASLNLNSRQKYQVPRECRRGWQAPTFSDGSVSELGLTVAQRIFATCVEAAHEKR